MDEMIAGTDIGFQSAPVIANGRIFGRRVFPQSESHGFNPRPLLLTGESLHVQVFDPPLEKARVARTCTWSLAEDDEGGVSLNCFN